MCYDKINKNSFCFFLGFNSINTFAQEGEVKLNQDPKLIELMKLKKEVNIETFTSGQYTIQIFNGKYDEGSELMDKLISEQKFKDVFFSFETPYYKIGSNKETQSREKDFLVSFYIEA